MSLFLSIGISASFALTPAEEPSPPEPSPTGPIYESDVVPLIIADGPRGLGVGFALGEPTGVNVAWRADGPSTFSGVAGWSLTHSHLHLHLDYLLTFARLQPDPALSLTLEFFAGLGPSIDLGTSGRDSPLLGIRAPVGVNFVFGTTPIDIYLELVPVLGLIPDTRSTMDGVLGLRLWFERD